MLFQLNLLNFIGDGIKQARNFKKILIFLEIMHEIDMSNLCQSRSKGIKNKNLKKLKIYS